MYYHTSSIPWPFFTFDRVNLLFPVVLFLGCVAERRPIFFRHCMTVFVMSARMGSLLCGPIHMFCLLQSVEEAFQTGGLASVLQQCSTHLLELTAAVGEELTAQVRKQMLPL